MRSTRRFVESSSVMILLGLLAAPEARAQNPPEQWSFSLGARESNELSRITDGVEQEGRIADNFNSSITYSTTGPRSTFSLFGRVGANVYREGDNRKRYDYGGGFEWSRTSSERLQTQLGASFSRGLRLETLSNLGVLPPDIQSTSGSAQWQLSYKTSPRTTLTTSLAYSGTHLTSSEPIDPSQIVVDTAPFVDELPRRFETGAKEDRGLPDAEGDVVNILATEGLFSKDTKSQLATAGAGLSRALTDRTSLGFDLNAGYRQIDYLEPDQNRQGAQAAFRVWATRRVGLINELGTNYQFERSLAIFPNTTVQTLNAGFSHTDQTRDLSYSLYAGASLYQADFTESRVSPVADTTFAAGITRSTRVTAQYRRQYSLSQGFGRSLLIDYGNASLSQRFGSKVDLTLIAGVSLASDPLQESRTHDARRYGGYLTYRIVESLRVGTSLYRTETSREERGFSQNIDRNMWSIFVTFATQFD